MEDRLNKRLEKKGASLYINGKTDNQKTIDHIENALFAIEDYIKIKRCNSGFYCMNKE